LTLHTYSLVGKPVALYQTYIDWLNYHNAISTACSSPAQDKAESFCNELSNAEKKCYMDPEQIRNIALHDFQKDVALSFAESSALNLRTNSICWHRMHLGNMILMGNAVLTMAISFYHYTFPLR
jgi:hypothetical protein